jgi:CHAT domain-containing protein/Flp pilus assembly protein TadD
MHLPAFEHGVRLAALLAFAVVPQSGKPGVSPRHPIPTRLTEDLSRLKHLVSTGEYASSMVLGQKVLALAKAASIPQIEVQARLFLGGAQMGTRQYRDALQTLMPARVEATNLKDFKALYSIDNNVAWIYLEMERLEAAAEFADQAMAAQKSWGKYDARPVILRALIYARSGDFPPAERLFSEAINYSYQSGDLDYAATAWNFLGTEYYNAGRLREARDAQTESFRLRKLHRLPDLDVSMRALGMALAAQGDLKTAEVLIGESLAGMGNPHSTAPAWVFYRDRGQLRLMQGNLDEALPDLRHALDLARGQIVIPTDDDRVTFESRLAELYSLYIDTGNRLYLKTRNAKLKEEIFEASEENRAASLRAVVPQPNDWRSRLPREHAEILSQLEAAERASLHAPNNETAAKVRMLRASLDTVESRAGAKAGAAECCALSAANRALDADSAVLTFHLGGERSWLWAISKETFEVYPLPPEAELAAAATEFRKAVKSQEPEGRLGDELGNKLFGILPANIQTKHRWILALDRELFDLPLPAVRLNGKYLIEDHALLLTPGMRFLEPAGTHIPFNGKMVAVGDAIYNRADPRWRESGNWFWTRSTESWPLARLLGSGKEARDAVHIWKTGEVLTGPEAVITNVERALAAKPAILHLATHVVVAPSDGRAGMLVFGLGSDGQPGFLTMREILVRPAPVGLVVMSGCGSGDAQARPATGLMGLTRAWLGAGAGEVLATQWPSADDGGNFFDIFYGDLHADATGGAPEALRKAQFAMMNSNSFRNKPAYWASYFVIGKM